MLGMLLSAALLGIACTATTTTVEPSCEVVLAPVEPESGQPGDTLVLSASPLTSDFDSVVSMDSGRAELVSVDREGCDTCDTCRDDNDCSPCGDCSACDLTCEESCEETITVLVPALDPGVRQVRVTNSYGSSNLQPFEVLAATSSDDTGGGGSDSGSNDDTASPADDTGAGGSDTGSAPPAAPKSLSASGIGRPGPWAEGLVSTEPTCADTSASAMSPR